MTSLTLEATEATRPRAEDAQPADILVFAPHPDDESLGCAWIIQQAVSAGKRVHVVLFTNGDGFPLAAAAVLKKAPESLVASDYLELGRIRQQEVLTATAMLGLSPADVTFLSYPDAGLDRVYRATGDISITQPFTQKDQTYGLIVQDYHTRAHATPAPYRRQAVLDDLTELMRALQPGQIYVTDDADTHADHQAAFWFVRDAANIVGWRGELYTYLIHSGNLSDWPWPSQQTPESPFESHIVNGTQVPGGLAWPPPVRQPMTHSQAIAKLQVLRVYTAAIVELPEEQAYIEAFVKSEEIFWRR
jgi:LmbE family N-acetylglucosaminyl deacetylase